MGTDGDEQEGVCRGNPKMQTQIAPSTYRVIAKPLAFEAMQAECWCIGVIKIQRKSLFGTKLLGTGKPSELLVELFGEIYLHGRATS